MKPHTHKKINIFLEQIELVMSYINEDIKNNPPKKDFASNVKWDELCIIRDAVKTCKEKIKTFNHEQ